MTEVEIRHPFSAPPDRVFAALADPEHMGDWLGMPVTVVVSTPAFGVGTVRRVHAKLMHVDEEILEHEPPHRIAYTIVSKIVGMRAHRGEVHVEPDSAGGSVVRWSVRIDSRIPGLDRLMLRGFKRMLGPALERLSRQLS